MNNPLIPDYIRRYLLGATPPLDCGVPPGTLPALVEGELNQARVATVGINPHVGLTRDLYPPLDAGGAELYWDDKRRYFHRQPPHILRFLGAGLETVQVLLWRQIRPRRSLPRTPRLLVGSGAMADLASVGRATAENSGQAVTGRTVGRL